VVFCVRETLAGCAAAVFVVLPRRKSIIRPLVYEKLGWRSWDGVVEAPFWCYTGSRDRS